MTVRESPETLGASRVRLKQSTERLGACKGKHLKLHAVRALNLTVGAWQPRRGHPKLHAQHFRADGKPRGGSELNWPPVRHHPGVKQKLFFLLSSAILAGGMVSSASAQGTAFLYQEPVNDGGSPATCSLRPAVRASDAVTNGDKRSPANQPGAVAATCSRRFFGPVFAGTNYWLSVGVRTERRHQRPPASWPRQPGVLPVPPTTSASNLLGKLPAAQLSGTLRPARLPATRTP